MMTIDRRARLATRHFLSHPAESVEVVADRLVGLHSSDPTTVFLSCRARVAEFAADHLEDALYVNRSLVRMLGMRRTMFVVPRELAPVLEAGCTRALAPPERRRTVKLLEDQGFTDDGAGWLDAVERSVLAALEERGQATASELTEAVPELGLRFSFGAGKTWGGTFGLSSRILFLLASEGKIVRARPRGSWKSSQYRWATTGSWLGETPPEIRPSEGRSELVRRWLGTYGPGTLQDVKWWSGWTIAQTRSALADVGAVEVELEEGNGYVLPDDRDPAPSGEPAAALLPALDPTVMGWKERDWFLGGHQAHLFDRNGNAGPTVWWDGRIVGGWAQRSNGEIVVRVLEDVGDEARSLIEVRACELQDWLGEVRVIPRFRTSLHDELSRQVR